ncbi:10165_t:CDS:2 [Cetraspora pellucida]|uniref:10165_t:CDS:1 n=1 Tax=Cetraspora pellucida TaxID=1433469 RepID=A0A9N9IBM9_9GLOM|nr:10165_t:CDS:2 [Cetraspora pellucida]
MTSYGSLSYFLISLFLLFSVISSVNSRPHKKDPCAPVIATANPKYNDVKNCLSSFPYDAAIAKKTVDVLKQYSSSFYSFFNQAREQAKPGFTFEPVDIIKELDKIIESNPKTEFEFMKSLRNTYIKLHDAHVQLFSSCYTQFLYDQRLHLYSVLDKKGNQIIKVFDDLDDHTNIDCEVTSIDSVPAFDAIKNFANNQSFISRDLGVRLNNALTSISLEDGKPWILGSEFTVRVDLPETDSITYTLNCPNTVTKNVTREWFVTFLEFETGIKSFYKDICLSSEGDRAKHKESHTIKKFGILPYISNPKLKNALSNRISTPSVKLSKATLVHDATHVKFYKSIGSDFGIVVFIDEEADNNGTLAGFKKLAEDSSIKKLVLDLSNNPGGFIDFAHLINSILLPSNSFNHTFFPYDMNVQSDIAKKFITSSFKPNHENFFSDFIDFETGKHFKSSKEVIGSKKIKRGGSLSSYSTKFTPVDLPKQIKLPWDTKNMIILSNGASGSAASMISQYLQEVGQVPTVSIGGFANQPLSFASFPGGIVLGSDDLFEFLTELGISDLPPLDSHYKGFVLTFPFVEAYSFKHPDTVLEFDFRPADHRLFYNEKNIRDPSLLWVEAVNLI